MMMREEAIMPDKSTAKLFEMAIVDKWQGYNSANDKTNIAENVYVQGSQNMYKKLNGNLAVRQGQKRIGEANSDVSPVSSEFIWNTSWGAIYPLWLTDNKLQVFIEGVWYTLMEGGEGETLPTRVVFDKWWSQIEQKDRVLFVNGTSSIFWWSGGAAFIASSTTDTITKTNPEISWKQAGFVAGDSINIEGNQYTFTGGEDTATLTGVDPDASGITPGVIALQTVEEEEVTPAVGFHNDFIKVINNQVYVGSYTSRLCYISASDDFTNYTVPTPRIPGSPELLTLDATLNGIGVRTGQAHISIGQGEWAIVSFQNITVGTDLTQQTTVDIKPVANLAAAYAHEFIDNVGDNLVYLSKDQQLRTFGDFNNVFVAAYPSLSQEIATELMAENFTGGGVRCIGDLTYITAPVSGKTYLYQVRQAVDSQNQVVVERLWHSPFIWNATRIDDYNGEIVAFSNANPQWYEVWDTNQWFDDSPDPVQDFSSELFLNGAFNGNADNWSFGDFGAYSDHNVVFPEEDYGSSSTGLFQTVDVFAGTSYQISFDCLGGTGNIKLVLGGLDTQVITPIINGHVTETIVCDNDDTVFALLASGVCNEFSVTNFSLKQIIPGESGTEKLPYSCILALSYRTGGRRQGLLSFDKLFSEGYITRGTPLNLTVNYNWNGATDIISTPVNSIERPAYLFAGDVGSLGDSFLGSKPLGDELIGIDDNNLSKFKVINSLSLVNCFEYQPIYSSDTPNAQWEILASGSNVQVELEQEATFIINKPSISTLT